MIYSISFKLLDSNAGIIHRVHIVAEHTDEAIDIAFDLGDELSLVTDCKIAGFILDGQDYEIGYEGNEKASISKRLIISALTTNGSRLMTSVSSPTEDLVNGAMGLPSETWGRFLSNYLSRLTDKRGFPFQSIKKCSFSDRPRAAQGITTLTKTSGSHRQ